jgi:hypothetical protein
MPTDVVLCVDRMIVLLLATQFDANVVNRNYRFFTDDAGTMGYAKREYKVQLSLCQSNHCTPDKH